MSAADVRNAMSMALSELASWDLATVRKVTGESEWKVRKKIDEGRYKSYLDGGKRKVIVQSIKDDQERLLKDQPVAQILPPADAWKKAAEVRRRTADADSKPRLLEALRQQCKQPASTLTRSQSNQSNRDATIISD